MSTYYDLRKSYRYYKYIKSILGMVSLNADSILDVGSNGVDLISWLPCKNKVSLDLENPLKHDGVQSIRADFITYGFKNRYDIVTCFQVLEHIPDEKVVDFAKKLLELGKVVVVSVPHMWPKGACEGHLQDPVDYKKLTGWFGQEPIYVKNIVEDTDNYRFGRMVCVFRSDGFGKVISELNSGEFSSYEDFAIENHYKKLILDSKFLGAKFCRICDEYADLKKNQLKSYDCFYKDLINIDKEEVLHNAIKCDNIIDAKRMFEFGECLYPFWTDVYGHPCFFKEWIRYLLSKNKYNEALSLMESRMDFYRGIITESDLKILFERYKNKLCKDTNL